MKAPAAPGIGSASARSRRCWPLALLPGLLLAVPAQAQVYRCERDGQIQFSDRPCAPGAQPAQLPPANVVQPETGSADLAREHDRRTQAQLRARAAEGAELETRRQRERADETRLRAARQRGDVVQGMSALDVRQLLGEPAQISTRSDAKNGDTEIWQYRDGKRSGATVSLRDGIVVQVRGARRKDTQR